MAGRSESMYLEKCRNKGRKNMKKKILTDVNFLHIIIKTFFETVFLNVSVIVKNKSARAKNEYFNV